jgi:hypothetical protein
MKTEYSHTQIRRCLHQVIKVLGLAIILLLFGSVATNPAQQIKRHIIISIDLVKEQQGKCPGYASVAQIFIDDVKQESYQAAVLPGSHKLSVNTPKENNIIIKEIRYEDWDTFKYPDGSTSAIPKTQTFTPNAPEATVSITAQPPNITSASQAQQPARLEIYWACQWAAAPPETFKVEISWRDDENDIFGDSFPLLCCLPKQVRVLAYTPTHPVAGAQTQLYFNDVLVATSETDQNRGEVIFELNLPDNLPKGKSQHVLKAQVQKNNGPPVVEIAAVEIARELSTIAVSLDPVSGEFLPGDAVRVTGRVWSLQNGLFMDPVKANIIAYDSAETNIGIPFRASTDDSGFFHVSPIVSMKQQLRVDEAVFIVVEASPTDRNKYEDGRVSFRVKTKTKGQLQVTAMTDKVVYDQGDSAVISGDVNADGKPIAGNVSIALSTGSRATTASGSSGQFSITMPLAPAGSGPPGDPIMIMPYTYSASIEAEAKGYSASPTTSAYFAIQELLCRAGRIAVASVVGNPSAQQIDNSSVSATVRGGGALVQGLKIQTLGSDKVTLAFDLGNGAYATVALNGGATVEVSRYCQDASGKVTLALKMADPGQVLVNVSRPTGASPNFQIVTKTAAITSVHTRYVVTVDPAGATHVAALDGMVRVGDPNGANSIDVAAGKVISVQTNQAPNKSRVLPIRGRLDPALDSLLANAPPPRGSAFPPLVSAGGHGGGGMPSPPSIAAVPTTTAPAPAIIDLTGLWLDSGGRAVYRVRQVGNRVYWSVDAGAGGSINVYVGEMSGNVINGVWVDLPQSSTYNTGQLNLRIDSKDHLVKVGENPCCYGAQEWRRQGTTAAAPPPGGAAPLPGGSTGAGGGGGVPAAGPVIGWNIQATGLRGKNGQRVPYTCPPNGAVSRGVWGTDIYTDDSEICPAAVHAGLITFRNGGPVTIEILPGQSSYTGSARNGVNSSPYGGRTGSFRFVPNDVVGIFQQVLPREAGPGPGAGPTGGRVTMEPNTNRRGQDYRNFDLAQPRPELCQAECAGNANCKAYTYVKPGLQGSNARCWLKSGAPTPQPDSCCISGVKGAK